MKLTEAAARYNEENRLRSRTLIHNCCRFAAHCGNFEVTRYTDATIADFRSQTVRKLSPWTIEKTITDVITVLKSQGVHVPPGKRLSKPLAARDPVPLTSIDAIWPHCSDWLRQWIVLSFWTASRLGDSLRLQLQTFGGGSVLQLRASKTGHVHRWPVPNWLVYWTQPQSLPYQKSNDNAQCIIRTAISVACNAAGVGIWSPKQLRQQALTAWSRADGMAGRIVHGSGLGVLDHYIDPLSVLESHQHKVTLPACFGATTDQQDIHAAFRRLDPDAQQLVRHTIERLSG